MATFKKCRSATLFEPTGEHPLHQIELYLARVGTRLGLRLLVVDVRLLQREVEALERHVVYVERACEGN